MAENELQPIHIPKNRELIKDDLPSEQQLWQLREQKGEDALACYAWRNALRVLPFIAVQPLDTIWEYDAVKHSFAIIRALALLQNKLRGNRAKIDLRAYAADAAYAAAYAADTADAAYAAAYAADAADAAYDADDAAHAVYAADDAAANAAAANAAAAAAYAAADHHHLQQAVVLQCLLDFNALVEGAAANKLASRRLWQNVPEHFAQLKSTLYHALNNIGLGFLQNDIANLLSGRVITAERIVVYHASVEESDSVLNNPVHLQTLFKGAKTQANRAVRVLLVGPGGAGKTSLFNLLLNRKKSPSGDATIAIDIEQIDLDVHRDAGVDVEIDGEFNDLDIYQWDFGGQSVFYNLHRGFMRRENCVYVLVVDSRHEQAPDDWLAQIQHYAQSDGSGEPPTVLVVTNAYENIKREQNQTYLARQFQDLLAPANDKLPERFFTLNCTEADARFNQFFEALLHACKASQKRIMATTFEAIDKLQSQFKGKKAVTISEFADTCFNKSTDDDAFILEKNSLEDLGYLVDLNLANSNQPGVVQQPGYQGDNLILDPKWITRMAYLAINHQALKSCGGYISRDNFKAKVLKSLQEQGELESSDNEVVIQFLVAQGVAYPFDGETKNNRRQPMLFLPDAAPAKEPLALAQYFQFESRWFKQEPTKQEQAQQRQTIIEYNLPVFPIGLKSHLAIQLLQRKHINISDYSPRDSSPSGSASSDNTSSDSVSNNENSGLSEQIPEAHAIPELNVWRDGLLANFDHGVQIAVFYHQAKHKVELRCAYSQALPESFGSQQYKQSQEQKSQPPFPANPIAEHALAEPIRKIHSLINHENILGKKRVLPLLVDKNSTHAIRDAIFCRIPGYHTTETRLNSEISSPNNSSFQSKPSTVYLSYAWGAENEAHQDISDAIVNAFEKDESIDFRRDKETIKNGESIVEFERKLGQSYQVIVIFSAKSLKSEHCMRELVYLQQTSLKEKLHFQQRVIPVILGDANITDALSIAEHEAYWIEQAEKLEAIASRSQNATMTELKTTYRDIANSIVSSLSWSADILLDRDWQKEKPYNLSKLVALVKQRVEQNQAKLT